MITALASAMNASMTRARFSVQMASFLKPRLCQELVRSTTHRRPAWSGKPFTLTHALAADLVEQIPGDLSVVAGVEMNRDLGGSASPNRDSFSRVGRRNGES